MKGESSYNPSNEIHLIVFDWVSELNRTQSDGLSSIEFDLFDWIRFVRKSNSLKVWCSISFDCRTQSNSIHRLSSIEFDWVRFSNVRFTMPGFIVLVFKLLRVIIKDILAKHSFTCKYFHHYLAINLAPSCPLIALKMKMNMNLKFG